MKAMNKKAKVALVIAFVALLILAVSGWAITNRYILNMDATQTVKFCKFFNIQNWYGEDIDESWSDIVHESIVMVRVNGSCVNTVSHVNTAEFDSRITFAVHCIDGIFIAFICLFAIGAIVFASILIADRLVKRKLAHSNYATVG